MYFRSISYSLYIKGLKILMLKIILGIVFALFLSLNSYAVTEKSYQENKFYVVSDSQIQDFLKKFIDNSVANVMMLVEFVTHLLRDAVGNKGLPGTKINKINMICLH